MWLLVIGILFVLFWCLGVFGFFILVCDCFCLFLLSLWNLENIDFRCLIDIFLWFFIGFGLLEEGVLWLWIGIVFFVYICFFWLCVLELCGFDDFFILGVWVWDILFFGVVKFDGWVGVLRWEFVL